MPIREFGESASLASYNIVVSLYKCIILRKERLVKRYAKIAPLYFLFSNWINLAYPFIAHLYAIKLRDINFHLNQVSVQINFNLDLTYLLSFSDSQLMHIGKNKRKACKRKTIV